jgi:hypothetical protein
MRSPSEVHAAGSSPADLSPRFPIDISERLSKDNAQDEKKLQNYLSHCRLAHHFESAKTLAFEVAEEEANLAADTAAGFREFKESYDELEAGPGAEVMGLPSWHDEEDDDGEGQLVVAEEQEDDDSFAEDGDSSVSGDGGQVQRRYNEDAMDEDEERFAS